MPADDRIPGDALAAVSLAFLLVLIGSAIGDTSLGILITVIDFFLLVYAMFRVPLRTSLLSLTFLVFVLPNPNDYTPAKWDAPFYTVGAVILTHLNAVDRSIGWASSLSFSGMDLLLLAMFAIYVFRRSSGSRVDQLGRVSAPEPLVVLAKVSIASTAFVWISGMVRGGDFGKSLWQLEKVLYVPLLFLLFNASLRGPRDNPTIAKLVLVAATYKALLAMYIIAYVKGPKDEWTGDPIPLPHATSHQDSVLFGVACLMLAVMFIERVMKHKKWLLVVLPVVIALGVRANNRRLAWVQILLTLLMVYVVSGESRLKQILRKLVMLATPVALLYVAVGWNSGSRIFKPVRVLRSVADAKTDGSSYWRELENFNLISTLKQNPIFGLGYGHRWEEFVVLPAVDYDLEFYAPHNSLLGIWAFGGLVGYAGLSLLWAGGVYFAIRAYHATKDGPIRAAALVCVGTVLVFMVQAWGDLGLGAPVAVYALSMALAVAGKLAVATGEWRPKGSKAPAAQAAPRVDVRSTPPMPGPGTYPS
jgi:hypothetical protein